ncbi:Phospholipase D alpha 4, partial [Mucuna pruriens]
MSQIKETNSFQEKNGHRKPSMSLWYEHTGSAGELFFEPESLVCVQRMRSIGYHMLEIYSSEEIVDIEVSPFSLTVKPPKTCLPCTQQLGKKSKN